MIRNGTLVRLALLCLLTMVCTGCPQRYVSRQVTLAVPIGNARDTLKLGVEHPDVQRAWKIVDEVLVTHGFAPTPDPALTDPGSLVTYRKAAVDGLPPLHPEAKVFLENERFAFVIGETRKLSAESKRIFTEIQKALRSHFGVERVRTES